MTKDYDPTKAKRGIITDTQINLTPMPERKPVDCLEQAVSTPHQQHRHVEPEESEPLATVHRRGSVGVLYGAVFGAILVGTMMYVSTVTSPSISAFPESILQALQWIPEYIKPEYVSGALGAGFGAIAGGIAGSVEF